MDTEIALLKQEQTSMNKKLDSIEGKLDAFIVKVENNYVSKETFENFSSWVYFVAWVMITALIWVIVTKIFKK